MELRPFDFVHIQGYDALEQGLLPTHELLIQIVVVVSLILVYLYHVLFQQLNVSLFDGGAEQLHYRHFLGESDVRNLLTEFLDQVFNVGLSHKEQLVFVHNFLQHRLQEVLSLLFVEDLLLSLIKVFLFV
jgi:hypothetical protein